MAKHKSRKKDDKKKFEYTSELYGLIFLLTSILGIGRYGPVGKLISAFGAFLVGNWYNIFLLSVLVIGIYLIIKREKPRFFNTKLIGFYLMFLGILILSHKKYIELNSNSVSLILKETFSDLMNVFDMVNLRGRVDFPNVGGGMIGAIFGGVFNYLFDYEGTRIIYWVLIVFGFAVLTGFSIVDFLKKGLKKGKNVMPSFKLFKRRESDLSDEVKINNASDEDGKVIISDINQLTSVKVNKGEAETDLYGNSNLENSEYKLPSSSLLDPVPKKKSSSQVDIESNINKLEEVLGEFGITGKVVEVTVGPQFTQYELELKAGTKLIRLTSINKEISLALAKKDIRIEAPIPGKSTCGIEIPNDFTTTFYIREIIESLPKEKEDSKLLVALGKDINSKTKYCEIDKMPHLLIAGSTGSGKSVCINSILASILMRTKPDEVKLLLIDPKKVELSMYNGTPHLLSPVVTDPKKASIALNKIVSEMERRYDIFEDKGVKNIATYNEWVEKHNQKFLTDEKVSKMPYIVVIVDELADLMMIASKEVEDAIMRITQMARAAGIHLIIATQRPSTDVITGIIKANIPSRMSFSVASGIDSRTILDMIGAEKLLGRGDMLFLPMGDNTPTRIQGAWITEDEVKRLVDYTSNQQRVVYDERMLNLNTKSEEKHDTENYVDEDDPLYNEIVEFIITTEKASASLLQRRFKLGYNRAARIIDILEERRIIGPQNGSKPRDVLVKLDKQNEEE